MLRSALLRRVTKDGTIPDCGGSFPIDYCPGSLDPARDRSRRDDNIIIIAPSTHSTTLPAPNDGRSLFGTGQEEQGERTKHSLRLHPRPEDGAKYNGVKTQGR